MKVKNRFKIVCLNVLAITICFGIIITAPLQFFDFIFKGKNRILKYLEDKVFRILFRINDLRKEI
ncbi:hypothetical protein [Flavobacterium sp.]|uniref:hypothetical protein n=1 Tax=Flavobacterium sp. TaxID=239 RepID=UPI00262B5B4F|nr:hypothetical protein [Flavobacterium sp.]